MNNFRKLLFLNSQYCTSYNENGNTILAGIFRNYGYKYAVNLPDEKLSGINKVYRKFTTLMNILVGAEILLYIYFVIFPFFIEFMKLPYFITIIALALIPLIVLYITYIAVNSLYENYLTKHAGTFKKVKFMPSVNNIDEKAFQQYLGTPRKSIYVLLLLVIIFCFYVLAPVIIRSSINAEKFQKALKLSNLYLKIVPISPEVYAQRAYCNFKLKNYKMSVDDYELANKYSLSNIFDNDILGVKTYFLPKNEVLKEFDRKINGEDNTFLMSEKALYLLKNKDYRQAINIYDKLLELYKHDEKTAFPPQEAYYYRGIAKYALGDNDGAKTDINISRKMCPDCKFGLNTYLIQKP